MGRYFEPYEKNEEDPEFPIYVREIRKIIERNFGKFDCTNRKIGELWREFSQEYYSAIFLMIEWDYVEEFVEWLKRQED